MSFIDTLDVMAPPSRARPVNVASVPQLSPFRYPGGKTWFVPYFRQWMLAQRTRPKLLVEPFAGGGIISLTAAMESLCDEVVMADLDAQVAAVWRTILSDDAGWLANRIVHFDMNLENARKVLDQDFKETRDIAFQTIVKNRTVHGGILAAGSGFLKNGEGGKGILSRWYPQTLSKRIRQIQLIRNKITFLHENAFGVLEKYKTQDAMFFIDPPYSVPGGKRAGSRLYTHWKIDHEGLFDLCDGLSGQFILTYDNAAEVVDMARRRGFQSREITMKNTHHAKMSELAVSKNMEWLS